MERARELDALRRIMELQASLALRWLESFASGTRGGRDYWEECPSWRWVLDRLKTTIAGEK
jgi:hypothetical protein